MTEKLDVTIVLLPRSHSSTAIAPMEIFSAVGVLWNLWTDQPARPGFQVRTVSQDGRPVNVDGPVQIMPERAFTEVRKTDLIVIPSAGLGLDAILETNRPLIPWLRRWRRKGAFIAGICSGVALLAEAGLLDGKRATTHWALVEDYRARYPQVDWQPHLFVTEDDGVLCGGGVYSAVDLSLYLVEKFCGHEVAVQCAKSLLVEMPRTCQAGFSVLPLGAQHADEDVRKAEEWIHGNYQTDFRIEDLAGRFGMSPRNFIRRFKGATGETPLNYLQKLRVLTAKRLLESGGHTVQGVGHAVGYEDIAFFRNLFKRHTGFAPGSYRQRFGASPVSAARA